jgi:dTDP-4-dehydrorhamnose reductase
MRVRAVVDDSHDNDDDTETDTYYGQIKEIWELDYVGLKVALFRCRWVPNGKRDVSKDKYVYVSVDLRVFVYKNELFVFANDVEHVFYVPDLAKKNWSVVMPGKKGLWGLKMLLRRRKTTSLTKFHPLTLHTSPTLGN